MQAAQQDATAVDALYAAHLPPSFEQLRLELPLADADEDDVAHGHTHVRVHAAVHRSTDARAKALLLVHGHPQNLVIWRGVARRLVQRHPDRFHIVLADIRGHGRSSAPPVVRRGAAEAAESGPAAAAASRERHKWRYSKREMGRDLFGLMSHLGFERFHLCGHDRGGRIAHRMALDEPSRIERLMVLDIAPTYDMYARTEARFASLYWHWFFLIQPFPAPESFITATPQTYLERLVTRFPAQASSSDGAASGPFPADVVSSYLEQLSSWERAHATCEDYRASSPLGVDLELDARDQASGRRLAAPLRVLWGERGICQLLYSSEDDDDDGGGRRAEVVRMWAARHAEPARVTGRAVACGHYLPEEAPDDVTDEIVSFFA